MKSNALHFIGSTMLNKDVNSLQGQRGFKYKQHWESPHDTRHVRTMAVVLRFSTLTCLTEVEPCSYHQWADLVQAAAIKASQQYPVSAVFKQVLLSVWYSFVNILHPSFPAVMLPCRSSSWLQSLYAAQCRPFAVSAKKVPAVSRLSSGHRKLPRHLPVWISNPLRSNRRTFSEGLCKHAGCSGLQTLIANQVTAHRLSVYQKVSLNWAGLQRMVPQCHSTPTTVPANKSFFPFAGRWTASFKHKAPMSLAKWLF